MNILDQYIRRVAVGALYKQHKPLDRHQRMLRRIDMLRREFNRFAEDKGAEIFEHATRIEHEFGYLTISYRTAEGRFCYREPTPDDESNLNSRFLEALTSAESVPHGVVSSTAAPTEWAIRAYAEACEAAKGRKPPLSPNRVH